MKEVVVIGDIHGCYKTFLVLLDKVKEQFPSATICAVGDLVDRGPDSRSVVRYFIDHPEILCVKANHEDMLCKDVLGEKTPYTGQWYAYQGGATLSSYNIDGKLDRDLLKSHAEWMDKLPLYLEFKDCIKIGDDSDHGQSRYLVVSHASLGSTWHMRDKSHPSNECFESDVLWNRDKPHDIKEIYNIFGHTPLPEGPKIKSFYANIDTGACFKRLGSEQYGVLTALHFPSMTVIQQKNIE